MSTGQKVAVSLLSTVLVFAVFAVAAFSRLFPMVEARFYQPMVIHSIQTRLSRISSDLNEYSDVNIDRFALFAETRGIKNSFEPLQNEADIRERIDFSKTLITEIVGLQGIRLIASDGRRIHFSTFDSDIIQNQRSRIVYDDYDSAKNFPYELISTQDSSSYKLVFDSNQSHLLFSFPVYDSSRTYRGSLVFSVDAANFSRYLVKKNSIQPADFPELIAPAVFPETKAGDIDGSRTNVAVSQSARKCGFVFGLPLEGRDLLVAEIEKRWQTGFFDVERLGEFAGSVWVLLSNTESPFGCIGWVYQEDMFLLPLPIRILLLACEFVTSFLIVFLIFSIKRDDSVIIRDRIRRFQLAFFQDYLENKEAVDWEIYRTEIIARKYDVFEEIKDSLGQRAVRNKEMVNGLLNRCWEEIVVMLSKKSAQTSASAPSVSMDQLKTMLEKILSTGTMQIQSDTAVSPAESFSNRNPFADPDESENIADEELEEDMDEIEDAEEIEELDEIEDAEDDVLNEIETGKTESFDEIDAEEIEEIEELDEIENEEDDVLDEIENAEPNIADVIKKKTAAIEQAVVIGELDDDDASNIIELGGGGSEFNLYSYAEYNKELSSEMELLESIDFSEPLYTDGGIIVEQDGLYSIPKEVPVLSAKQDPVFKSLVESIV